MGAKLLLKSGNAVPMLVACALFMEHLDSTIMEFVWAFTLFGGLTEHAGGAVSGHVTGVTS